MLLIMLGIALIVAGVVGLNNQEKILEQLRRASGTLLAYIKDEATGKFYALVGFSHNTDKHFFKNATPFSFPEHALGSQQRVFYEAPAVPEVFGTPLKATLQHSEQNTHTPRILIALGLFFVLLFSELSGIYFLFVLFAAALYFYFSRSNNALHVPRGPLGEMDKSYLHFYPVSDTFNEEKLAKFKQLDLNTINRARENWHNQQRSKGLVLLAFTVLCIVCMDFSVFNQPEAIKAPKEEKALSISQVLDAGSVSAASDNIAEAKEFVSRYCFSFQSESCYYTYKVLDDAETTTLLDRLINFAILNIALISLGFALIFLFSQKIFAKYDSVPVAKKDLGT